MFRNLAIIILFYYVIKNKIELPIIIPMLLAFASYESYYADKKSFLHSISTLNGTPLRIEYFTILISCLLMTFYLLNYINKELLYLFIIFIIIYILLMLNQIYYYFQKK
jgi:hypothetical protein